MTRRSRRLRQAWEGAPHVDLCVRRHNDHNDAVRLVELLPKLGVLEPQPPLHALQVRVHALAHLVAVADLSRRKQVAEHPLQRRNTRRRRARVRHVLDARRRERRAGR